MLSIGAGRGPALGLAQRIDGRGQAGDLAQRRAIVQEQDDQGQRRAGGEELLAGEGQAGPAEEQFEQCEEQERDHGTEDQVQDAVLPMDVERAHRQRTFDQGEAFLGHIAPFGLREHPGRVQVWVVGAEYIATIDRCGLSQRRFRRNPAACLADVEDRQLKPVLPA